MGEAVAEVVEAGVDGGGPAVEVVGEEAVDGGFFFGDLEGEAADGAAVGASGGDEVLTVEAEDAEDSLDGVGGGGEYGVHNDGMEGLDVELEDGDEEVFFGLEEVVETARVDLGVGEDLGHTGGCIPLFPEEIERGFDKALAGFVGLLQLIS